MDGWLKRVMKFADGVVTPEEMCEAVFVSMWILKLNSSGNFEHLTFTYCLTVKKILI
jgi:hypothetical protein